MKIKILIIIFISLAAFSAQGQTNTFQNMQGIKQEKATFYDAEGYQIFLQELDYNLDEKGIHKVRKKYSIPKESHVTEDADFPGVKILNAVDSKGDVKSQSVYYLSSAGPGKIKIIGFSTFCDRVKSIEKEYYQAIDANLLPENIYTPTEVDTIQFAGRAIDLGPVCGWRGVRNVQCPNLGQMNWSEFSSAERAQQMIAGQRTLNAELKMGEVLEDSEVAVVFEGTPVKALKRKLKIKIPKLIMGGSNILIIYYVMAEVRGRYVACVLSHYTDDRGAMTLPPLLREVMQLKD